MNGEWQDGSTAPKNNTSILSWVQEINTNETFYLVLMWYIPFDENDPPAWRKPDDEEPCRQYNVLFWMPLPDPPEGQTSAY